MEGMASFSGEAQTAPLGRASSWLVFKKRAGSMGKFRLRRRRAGERRARGGVEESCVASSVEFGAEADWNGRQASARPPPPATRRGESAKELSVAKRLDASSAPASYSFTAVRNGWIHSRVSRIFARWATEDTPAVPLVPRFSAHTLMPNREAYFNDAEAGTVTCCTPSPVPDAAAGDGAASKPAYLCKRCWMRAEMETVHVDLRVGCGGHVRVHVQVVKSRGWDSDTLIQRRPSGRILNAVPSSKKKPASPGWGCIPHLFAVCRQPQILM